MRVMPMEYHGREQTWLKHRVLEEYLSSWSHKLASAGGRDAHLWYVDVFAGPWESQAQDRRDTSVAIGLEALNRAAETWRGLGRVVHLHAAFVEKSPRSFVALRQFTDEARGQVDVHTFEGTFGAHVDAIDRLLGGDPAFIFVDPKGWDGAGLRLIARLGHRRWRDLIVNLMYGHINRFKDDEREFLRSQMREFFGLTEADLPAGLDEEQLIALYRKQLQTAASVPYVADISVPDPTRARTKFRLIVAGHHPKVVELFRDVEARVIGKEAAQVRTHARVRADEKRTGQLALLSPVPPADDERYSEMRAAAEALARVRIPELLAAGRPVRWDAIWPELLCEVHLRLVDLRTLVADLEREGVLVVQGKGPRERSVKDEHVLMAARR